MSATVFRCVLIDPADCSLTGGLSCCEQTFWQQALPLSGCSCLTQVPACPQHLFQPFVCCVQGLTSEGSSTELDKLRQPGAGPVADASRLGEKQTPSALRSNVLG